MEKKKTVKSIAYCAFWGAVGFGTGGLVSYLAYFFIPYSSTLKLKVICYGLLFGAIGGALLGKKLCSQREAKLMAIYGAIGFGVGFLCGESILRLQRTLIISSYITGTIYSGIWTEVLSAAWGAIIGVMGGISLGIALKGWKKLGLLALAGAAGFGIASGIAGISTNTVGAFEFVNVLIIGIIGGASMGATLGYINKKRASL